MNRLIIIGNGFDLAHRLPTSYRDFIYDFWIDLKDRYKEETYQEIIEIRTEHDYFLFEKDIKSYDDFINNLKNYCVQNRFMFYEEECVAQRGGTNFVTFKNLFLRKISNRSSIQNWVDIENEYYALLKEISYEKLVGNNLSSFDKENLIKRKKTKIEKLNKEFEEVKSLFEKYLNEKVLDVYNFEDYHDSIGNQLKFPNIFKPISFIDESEAMELFLNEFPLSSRDEIKNQFIYRGDELINDCNVTFLSFNYTPTLNNYISILNHWQIENSIIHIHGFINDSTNKINFGFGDEMDDDYKMIENINDNEYLKNFKSFQYLHTSNYKNLLNLIDSDHFQVYLMGHSCGLSDRTLLNTIFEHNNCKSIKVFYHEIKDEKGNIINDNYTEITQNISRHFTKKKLMREKIVNKTLCKPLPQIQLPKKV